MSSLKRKFIKENTYPVSIEWIIKEENLRKVEDTKALYSPVVDVYGLPDVRCCIQLVPKRIDTIQTGETYAFMNLKMKKHMNVTAYVQMDCKSANFSRDWTVHYTKSTGSGMKICNYVDLFNPAKKVFVDKELIIKVSAILTLQRDEHVEAKVPKLDKSLGYMLWESEADKDVSLVIDGENELKAHKCVLKRRSMKFAKLLNIKPESGTSDSKVVVQNIAFDTVKEAIMHCYDIQGKEFLSAEDATNMLIFANEYDIEDLKESMEEFCVKSISVSNACLYANSSIAAKSEKLEKCCCQFLAHCMKTGTAVKDIANLNAELKESLFLQSFSTIVES